MKEKTHKGLEVLGRVIVVGGVLQTFHPFGTPSQSSGEAFIFLFIFFALIAWILGPMIKDDGK